MPPRLLQQIDRLLYRLTPRSSVTRFCGVPTARLQVSRYWVYSPTMDEPSVLALERAGEWDRTEEGGTCDRSRVLERGRFPYVFWDGSFAFAVKEGRGGFLDTWWEMAEWAQRQESEGGYRPGRSWSDAIGPVTESTRSRNRFRRGVSHWQVDAEVGGEVFRVKLRQLGDGERGERARCLSQLVEVYEPYGQWRGEMLVFLAERGSS